MPHFTPDSLARWTRGRWTGSPPAPISGFSADSRRLQRGEMFVALKTQQRDGHDFLAGAFEAGASAALVSRPDSSLKLPQLAVADPLASFQAIAQAHRRTFNGPVVGISGSAGKTSTKDMLALLLGRSGEPDSPVLATEGNLNNHIGVPLTLTRLDPAVHRYAVVEAGISAPGEMDTLAAMIEPDVAIITLIAAAHLSELKSLEGVAREKAALAAAVRSGGRAIFPQSCADLAAFKKLTVPTLVVERTASLPERGAPGSGRVFFTVVHDRGATEITLGEPGAPPLKLKLARASDGMAQNAVLAVCAALRLGVSGEEVRERIARWHPAKWRGQVVVQPGRLLYLDFYNANPASMADALETFRSHAPSGYRKIYLIGCMEELGAASEAHHRELGRSLRLGGADSLFVIGAQAGAVREGALESGASSSQIFILESIGDDLAARLAQPADCAIFVKGSRRYQLERALASLAPQEASHA